MYIVMVSVHILAYLKMNMMNIPLWSLNEGSGILQDRKKWLPFCYIELKIECTNELNATHARSFRLLWQKPVLDSVIKPCKQWAQNHKETLITFYL